MTVTINKRILLKSFLFLLLLSCYLFFLTWALRYSPYGYPPAWFRYLPVQRTYNIYLMYVWFKIHHTVVLTFVSVPIAILIEGIFKDKAYLCGFVVGMLTVVISEVNSYRVLGIFFPFGEFTPSHTAVLLIIRLSDWLAVAGALPLVIWFLKKVRLFDASLRLPNTRKE